MFLRCRDALRLWRSLQVLEGQIVRINSFTPSQLSGCGIGSIWWLSPTRPLIFGSCDQEKPTGVLKVDIFQEVSCIDGTLLDVFLFLDTRYRSCFLKRWYTSLRNSRCLHLFPQRHRTPGGRSLGTFIEEGHYKNCNCLKTCLKWVFLILLGLVCQSNVRSWQNYSTSNKKHQPVALSLWTFTTHFVCSALLLTCHPTCACNALQSCRSATQLLRACQRSGPGKRPTSSFGSWRHDGVRCCLWPNCDNIWVH